MGPRAALAQDALVGDAAAGEEHFQRQRIACHVVRDKAGNVLAGRSARTGPNLHGVIGRVPGTHPDFDYSDLLLAFGAMEEEVWQEENFVGFVQDPTSFMREATGESGNIKMSYQVRDEQQAQNLYAFLATFSPESTGEDAAADETGNGDAAGGEAPADGEAAMKRDPIDGSAPLAFERLRA